MTDQPGTDPQRPADHPQWPNADDPWARRPDEPTQDWSGTGGYGGQSGWQRPGDGQPTVPLEPGTPSAPAATLPHEQLWSSYLGQPSGEGPERPGDPPRRGVGVPMLLLTALLAAVLGGGVGAGLTLLATDETSTPAPVATTPQLGGGSTTIRETTPGSVASIASKLLPSVVEITVNDSSGQPEGTGSGVVTTADGYIITNNHVVADASGIEVAIGNDSVEAKLVGTDPETDLAVIKAESTRLIPASLGSSNKLRVGDPVIAIGSPLGLSGTVTTGIISALNRQVRLPPSDSGVPRTLYGAIQTDAAINPGNSGGALVDAGGNVIGINSAIASLGAGVNGQGGSIGLGFAIPIDLARDVAQQLISTGKAVHPFIGVNVKTIDENTARELKLPIGALVAEVVSGGPADQAGLQKDDVVTKVGDKPISSSEELILEIRQHKVGETVRITYNRGGKERTAELKLAEKPRQP
jgi:putative serine protease PepD